MKNLHRVACKFDLDQSERTSHCNKYKKLIFNAEYLNMYLDRGIRGSGFN